MPTVTALPVQLAEPLPGDAETLSRWSGEHLATCEAWLSRRRMLAPAAAVLRRLRLAYPDPGGVDAGVDGARAIHDLEHRRPSGDRAAPNDRRLAALATRLSADLTLYGESLRLGAVDRLTVTPIEDIPVPLHLPGCSELFLPSWAAEQVSRPLFEPVPLFPEPPPATLSWLFFQSLVVGAGAGPVPTVAAFLGVRESN